MNLAGRRWVYHPVVERERILQPKQELCLIYVDPAKPEWSNVEEGYVVRAIFSGNSAKLAGRITLLGYGGQYETLEGNAEDLYNAGMDKPPGFFVAKYDTSTPLYVVKYADYTYTPFKNMLKFDIINSTDAPATLYYAYVTLILVLKK